MIELEWSFIEGKVHTQQEDQVLGKLDCVALGLWDGFEISKVGEL